MLALGFRNVLLKLLIKCLLVRQNIVSRGEGQMQLLDDECHIELHGLELAELLFPLQVGCSKICPNKCACWLGNVEIGDQINQLGVSLGFKQSSDVVSVDQ